jgi:hypothetical protein
MTRVRTSLHDYKMFQDGNGVTDKYRQGHTDSFSNREKQWCPHCRKVLKPGEPTCQWCGESI